MQHQNWTDYNISRKKNKNPTIDDDRWLVDKFKNGSDRENKKASEQVLELYGNLAHSIAIKCKGRGVELEDLLQSAKMGLLYSLTKYDKKTFNFFIIFHNLINNPPPLYIHFQVFA